MRKSRFTEAQIVAILQESTAGAKTADLLRHHGISAQTLYSWKRKFGGMTVSEAARLKALEEENRRLNRLVADQALKIQVLKDVVGKEW
jgi:putative transposase